MYIFNKLFCGKSCFFLLFARKKVEVFNQTTVDLYAEFSVSYFQVELIQHQLRKFTVALESILKELFEVVIRNRLLCHLLQQFGHIQQIIDVLDHEVDVVVRLKIAQLHVLQKRQIQRLLCNIQICDPQALVDIDVRWVER